ncbi:nucleolus protein [Epithele typhae]|uniref:nucleolus protein n=1 Tax=Epithele typhae TaxID=378194 RepID=UPI0020071FE1|nr:nucleolus protein [Epithele typhae]KAH9946328.1 nucleolus protein [Epithele typhae]
MPKARKHRRKVPVTAPPPIGPSHSAAAASASARPQVTRDTIRRFHVLLKRQTQLKAFDRKGRGNARASATELADIEREIEELGGLAEYQRMSTIGQGKDRGGGSEKILIPWLREVGLSDDVQGAGSRARLLEVGALKPDNYASCQAWLDVTPIDLHSQHPAIEEKDFLLMNPAEHREKWDVISLSLVLNFVPDAKDRGTMLRLAHTILRPEGLLFVALPLPCILNSRYMTAEHYKGLMETIGFEEIRSRWKEGGKMAYWLFRRTARPASLSEQQHTLYDKKTTFRTGNRNNFVVLL